MRLSSRISQVQPSATLALTARAGELRSEGHKVISLAAGEPDFNTPVHISEAAAKAAKEGFTRYTPVAGIPALRDAVANLLKSDYGLEYSRDQILISCGGKHSLYNVLQVTCEEGDEVLFQSPYWVSYPEMVRLASATPVILETTAKENFKITPENLKAKLSSKSRVLILNSPSNPTGVVYDREELEELVNIAVEAGLLIISDEIYDKIIYDGAKHVCVPALSAAAKEHTIWCNAVSKTYAMTGWRVGYVAGDLSVIKAATRLQSHSTSNPVSVSQYAALAALQGDQTCVQGMLKAFTRRRQIAIDFCESHGIPYVKPQGAFYLFLGVSQWGLTGNQFSDGLLDDSKVVVVPGEAFGCSTHVRCSFACGDEELKEGLELIAAYGKKVLTVV
ncbi:MAG: pyridoxal phosphate-dependent aminotransferase [Candidatus Omnitrophica bacterium]|nr:pyridoxal phosphate-dependent aminotransferase [Candidatus Omnitrophota bacterium]